MKTVIFYVLYVVSQISEYPDTLISHHRSHEECVQASQKLINQGLSSYCAIQKEDA